MLENLLKYNSLGSKDELLFLLFNALPLSKGQHVSDLKKYCATHQFTISRSFDGILALLEFITIVTISDGIVTINEDALGLSVRDSPNNYFQQGEFIEKLFASLKRADVMTAFIPPDAVRFDPGNSSYYVKESLVPVRYLGIRNLLLSVGFFERDITLGSKILYVSRGFSQTFRQMVVDCLKESKPTSKRKFSLAELKTHLIMQEQCGEQAELFVLELERKRLQGHPAISNIRRVSEDYVNAGYDVESFNDKTSVFIDRYIEVKSFSGDATFYWSRNEIQVARDMADKYFLYLVDRSKLSQPGYVPRIYQNPHARIFENAYWEKEPETWRINALPFEGHTSDIDRQ